MLRLSDKDIDMAISLNQAQNIVQKLSNEQLMQEYTTGNIPQFVVFSEMQRRQSMANSNAQAPTQTVAERLVGSEEPEGIASMQPQMAAKGGITRASPLDMGYSEDLPPEARKIISMRLKEMRDLEEPYYNPPQYAAEGDLLESQAPTPSDRSNPLSSREIADMLLHPVKMTESGGRQSAVSPKGARGVMQIMPKTGPEAAKLAGLKWDYNKYANDEAYNTKLGHAYLTSMIDRFGDTEKALAAYNWGPGNLSGALEKAKATGRDWKSFLPAETSAYIGKVLDKNQAYLPARQDAEGGDAEPPRYGFDPTFGGGRDITPPSYDYQRRSPLLDPNKMQSTSSIDKGLAALRSAQAVRGLRFAGGSDGEPIDGDYVPSDHESRSKDGERKPKGTSFLDRLKEAVNAPSQDAATWFFGARSAEQDKDAKPQELLPTPSQVHGSAYSGANATPRHVPYDQPQPNYPYPQYEGTTGDIYQYPRPEQREGTPGASVPESEGIASALPVGMGSPPRGPASPGGAEGDKGSAGGGRSAGTPGVTDRDTDFKSVMAQVKDAIGSEIPNEMKEQMKEHQKTISQMRNDKVVDTLMAAAKTLAGQRVGQRNFGDAVANAGIAAQEAQKRIYKAEDDMRKYRGDLLKAQDENNYRAANIAMNRIVQIDHDKRALEVAVMQAAKAHETTIAATDRAEKAADARNVASVRSQIAQDITEANKALDGLIKPDKVDLNPEATAAEKARLQARLAGLYARLRAIESGKMPEALPPAVTNAPQDIGSLIQDEIKRRSGSK